MQRHDAWPRVQHLHAALLLCGNDGWGHGRGGGGGRGGQDQQQEEGEAALGAPRRWGRGTVVGGGC